MNIFCFTRPVIFNQILVGLCYGWLPPMLAKLQNADSVMPVNGEQASWIASAHEAGRIAGPFLSPFIVGRIGRKHGVILVTSLLFLVWPSQIYLHNVTLLCVVRLLFGVTNGVSDVVTAVYLTENCSSEFRAILGPLLSVTFALGSNLELVIATYLSYRSTAVVNTILSGCAFSGLYFCMETPSFLILTEKYDKAERNLSWLRGGSDASDLQGLHCELEKLKKNVLEEKSKQKSLRALFASTANVRSLFIVLSMYIFGSATGNNVIGAYAVIIFQSTKSLSPYQFTILGGIIHTFALCASPVTVSKFGRRPLLVVGYTLIGLCNICIWYLIYLHNKKYEIAFYPWLIFTAVMVSGCLVAWVAPGLYVARMEFLPLSVRALGSSVAVVASSIVGFTTAKTFQPVTSSFGMEANFLVYAIVCVVCSVFIFFTLPETRGKTADEIRQSLEGKLSGDRSTGE